MGPASHVEEQVVLRAFWKLQLFPDLRWAAREGRLTAWASEDVQRLSDITPEEFFGAMRLRRFEEIMTVAEFLEDVTGRTCTEGIPEPSEKTPVLSRISPRQMRFIYPTRAFPSAGLITSCEVCALEKAISCWQLLSVVNSRRSVEFRCVSFEDWVWPFGARIV